MLCKSREVFSPPRNVILVLFCIVSVCLGKYPHAFYKETNASRFAGDGPKTLQFSVVNKTHDVQPQY